MITTLNQLMPRLVQFCSLYGSLDFPQSNKTSSAGEGVCEVSKQTKSLLQIIAVQVQTVLRLPVYNRKCQLAMVRKSISINYKATASSMGRSQKYLNSPFFPWRSLLTQSAGAGLMGMAGRCGELGSLCPFSLAGLGTLASLCE